MGCWEQPLASLLRLKWDFIYIMHIYIYVCVYKIDCYLHVCPPGIAPGITSLDAPKVKLSAQLFHNPLSAPEKPGQKGTGDQFGSALNWEGRAGRCSSTSGIRKVCLAVQQLSQLSAKACLCRNPSNNQGQKHHFCVFQASFCTLMCSLCSFPHLLSFPAHPRDRTVEPALGQTGSQGHSWIHWNQCGIHLSQQGTAPELGFAAAGAAACSCCTNTPTVLLQGPGAAAELGFAAVCAQPPSCSQCH